MKHLEIEVKIRENVGKRHTKTLRKQGNVPCVLYGNNGNIHFYAEENRFRKLVYTPNAYTVKLKFEDKVVDAILQDIQFHPVKDNIMHIDFLQVYEDKPLKIGVPVKLHGFPKGVQEGGKLQLEQRRLLVKSLLKHLPDVLDIDVENLGLGKVLKVGELKFDNIELIDNPNTVVASVKLTRAAKGMEDEKADEDEETREDGEVTPAETEEKASEE